MKKSKRKGFTLNVTIVYFERTNPNNYREPLHSMFKHISWLHGLDYAIESETKLFDKGQPETKAVTDIVYLRSGKNTLLTLKEFQKIIEGLFSISIASFSYGVDVFYQNQAALKLYPFPLEFFRPLNYPYVEHHKGTQKDLLIHKEAIGLDLDLIPNPN